MVTVVPFVVASQAYLNLVNSWSHKHAVNIKGYLNYVFLLAQQIFQKYSARNFINTLKLCLSLKSNEEKRNWADGNSTCLV